MLSQAAEPAWHCTGCKGKELPFSSFTSPWPHSSLVPTWVLVYQFSELIQLAKTAEKLWPHAFLGWFAKGLRNWRETWGEASSLWWGDGKAQQSLCLLAETSNLLSHLTLSHKAASWGKAFIQFWCHSFNLHVLSLLFLLQLKTHMVLILISFARFSSAWQLAILTSYLCFLTSKMCFFLLVRYGFSPCNPLFCPVQTFCLQSTLHLIHSGAFLCCIGPPSEQDTRAKGFFHPCL